MFFDTSPERRKQKARRGFNSKTSVINSGETAADLEGGRCGDSGCANGAEQSWLRPGLVAAIIPIDERRLRLP
jgi:hypothetical protein